MVTLGAINHVHTWASSTGHTSIGYSRINSPMYSMINLVVTLFDNCH